MLTYKVLLALNITINYWEQTMNVDFNITDIRAFVLIAKEGSFTAAAELLSCSRSHLSIQLSQLEASLDVKLIIRTTTSQCLTEQGKLFYEQCSRALDIIDQAIVQVMDDASAIKGGINVNCAGGIIGEEIITPMINDFIKQYPDVKVDLDFSDRCEEIVTGEFDIVFSMGSLDDSNLTETKLIDIPLSTLASPEYLQMNGQLTHPTELEKHDCITGKVNHWNYYNIESPNNKVDVNVKGAFKCKNGRAMISSAIAGNGIIRLPFLYCYKEIAEQKLLPVFIQWNSPVSPFYLIYLQDKYQPARLRAFIEFVNTNIAKYTETGE